MDHCSQAYSDKKIITEKHVLALSWNIATEPKLYRQLASNPYSYEAFKIMSIRFPRARIADCIRAVILAEPEGKYNRDYGLLTAAQQEEAFSKQKEISVEINKRLIHYYKKNKNELSRLPKEVIYNCLFLVVFATTDIKKIEQNYAQEQRQDFKFAISNAIEEISISKDPKRKPLRKLALLLVVFSVFLLMLILYVVLQQIQSTVRYPQVKKQLLAVAVQDKNQGFPMRLKIPTINVDAAVEYVGITSKGAMDVPINTIDVGLFKFGPYPGENGNSVIAGHYDSAYGTAGVFTDLYKLKKGDKVYINYANGISLAYVVRESRTYDPGYAKDVFSNSDNAHLNLITCEGIWDADKKSYSKRLVVFTDITH